MTTNTACKKLPSSIVLVAAGFVVGALAATGCTPSNKEASKPAGARVEASAAAPSARVVSAATALVRGQPTAVAIPHQEPPKLELDRYPWHADTSLDPLAVHDDLLRRVDAPAGYTRVQLQPDSFGAWLRRLPLAAPGTPVLSYRGGTILPADHPNLTAVATIDVGKADLQQCADVVMRLHAEWMWSRGKRDMSYRAASGTPLPYARWERGERVVANGQSIGWVQRAASTTNDHASFRKFLDAVFAWSNTVALSRQAKEVALDELRPGDFMILPGNPGHTVLVLDLATDAEGHRKVLLGQSYMPAQSFHVLRPRRGEVWFDVNPEAEGIMTPFWPKPFPWSSFRRLD